MNENYSKKEFLEPWYYVKSDGSLENELYKELGKKHTLYGKKLVAIARRFDQDDVLFSFIDAPTILAVVHLTWKSKKESNSSWPSTMIYNTWEEWVSKQMKPDYDEFNL